MIKSGLISLVLLAFSIWLSGCETPSPQAPRANEAANDSGSIAQEASTPQKPSADSIRNVMIEDSIRQSIARIETHPMSGELPDWFIISNALNGAFISKEHSLDLRLNPKYLEADFNGDGVVDVALSIVDTASGKVGFAIVHGGTFDIHFMGAGREVKFGLSDDMLYINMWSISTKKDNEPGLDVKGNLTKKGHLLLENPALRIENDDIGGGLIYWDGTEYAYFHQTC